MNTNSKRYLYDSINLDALKTKKIAFISGPRQVGKSTLAKALVHQTASNFFSWDQTTFKKKWIKDPESILLGMNQDEPIVLDEIHKDRKWKQRLKGLYDIHGEEVKFIVTGSARLDYYRKGSDSLLGRYFPYRLHPFSVTETDSPATPDEILTQNKVVFPWKDLMKLGGFPEPLLQASEARAKRWSRLRLDRILLEDIRDFRNISDIESLKLLTELIPDTIGSLLSINSLREDLNVAYATVRSWVYALEALYFGFYVKPFVGKARRMVRSKPKFYLYDILPIETESKRQENLAALHLLKACQYWTDMAMGDFSLCFLRNKDKKEVDFCITKDKKPWMLIECKSGSNTPSNVLVKFSEIFGTKKNYQLVNGHSIKTHHSKVNITVMDYETFFSGLI